MVGHRGAPGSGGAALALALAAGLLAGCASHLTRPREVVLDAPEVVLPVQWIAPWDLITLETFVNGAGPFAFYLDTGMATTLVSPEVARHRVGGADPEYATMTLRDGSGNNVPVQGTARLGSVRSGGLELRDLDVCVLDLDGLSATLGRRVDGVLGYPCFAEGLLVIDYIAREVRFTDGSLGPVDDSTVFPLVAVGVPVLDLRMGDACIPVLLDSGTSMGVTLGELPPSVRFHEPPVPAAARSGPSGQIRGEKLGRVRGALQFGPCVLEDPVVRLKSGRRGVIGTGVLANFRVSLDLAHGRFALEGGPSRLRFPLTPETE